MQEGTPLFFGVEAEILPRNKQKPDGFVQGPSGLVFILLEKGRVFLFLGRRFRL